MRNLWRWMTALSVTVGLGLAAGCSEPPDRDADTAVSTADAGDTGEESEPTLQVVDEVIIEGAVVGETSEEEIVFRNTGEARLTISSVSLTEGDEDEVAEEYARGDSWFESVDIAPGASRSLEVAYIPQNETGDSAEVSVETNDPARTNATVDVRVIGDISPDEPCLKMKPPNQRFGEVEGGMSKTREVVLAHCRESGPPLRVEYWRLTGSGFRMVEGIGGPFEIPAGDSVAMPIVFEPTGPDSYRGRLMVETDDPEHRSFDVELFGEGTRDRSGCPDAVAGARLEGSSGKAEAELRTRPFETVVFDGANSTDPDGFIDRYRWSLVKRPTGSSARLSPNRNARRPRLFVDMAGTYLVELSVEDESGLSECESPARVTVTATPGADIYVELVWRTPRDPIRNDSVGADLDLHYMDRRRGDWNQKPYDIFSGNKTADWGMTGASKSDPTLRREDSDGIGPEVIGHSPKTTDGDYAVGVYYLESNGFGHSFATVRIYIDGELKREYANKYLEKTYKFWHVADIAWPMKVLHKRDKMHDGIPN